MAAGISIIFSGLTAGAVPAKPGIIEMEQPDGTPISVRLSGDERAHYTWSSDGYLLTLDSEGFYTIADTDATGVIKSTAIRAVNPADRLESDREALRKIDREAVVRAISSDLQPTRRAARRDRGLYVDGFKLEGAQHALVVLVDFPNQKFSIPNERRFFMRMLNEIGFSDYKATGSVYDYYKHNSGGSFTLECDVKGPITLPQPYEFYGGNYTASGDDNAYMMAIDACRLLDETVDFSQYDTNGDGKIDTIYIIYAGYGEADGGPAYTVWPHSWSIKEADPRRNHVFDGVTLDIYSCVNELRFKRDSDELVPVGIGPFIHEFNHVLGLPDLYSTDGNPFLPTPGGWDVMDSGVYNNDSRTPPYFSCYELYALGWIEPHSFNTTCTIELEPFVDSRKCYLMETSNPNEFYMIENRQQKGNDLFLPNHGMLVWHIDFDQEIWNENQANIDGRHLRIRLIPADDVYSPETVEADCFPGPSNRTYLNCSSSPYLVDWSGKVLPVDFSNIEETPEGNIRMDVTLCTKSAGIDTPDACCPLKIEGLHVSYTGPGVVPVYDLTGRKAGEISSTPILLAPGIYTTLIDGKGHKFLIR